MMITKSVGLKPFFAIFLYLLSSFIFLYLYNNDSLLRSTIQFYFPECITLNGFEAV